MRGKQGGMNLLSLVMGEVLLGLLGCGSGDGIGGAGQGGGAEDSAAFVRILSIQPIYREEETSNVDLTKDVCDEDDLDTPQEEGVLKLRDHMAILTLSNSLHPGAANGTDPMVTFRDYSVEYFLNSCLAGAICPDLEPLVAAQTVTLPPNSSLELQLPFVQLDKKFEYLNKLGSPDAYPSYAAVYTLEGTDSFKRSISVQGAAEFTIGDFDYCPE